MLIRQYIKTNKNTFCKSFTFELPNPYWKVVDGKIYSVFATGKYGTNESVSYTHLTLPTTPYV